MKKLILLFVLSIVLLTSVVVAQVTQISGTTKWKTPMFFSDGSKVAEKLPAKKTVIIVDVDDFFIIQYKEGHVYVSPRAIEYNSSELNELKKTRAKTPIVMKEPLLVDDYIPIIAVSQTQKITDITKIEDKYKYEIDHIRYCAGRYRNEIMTGYAFSFAGAVATGSAIFIDNSDDIKLVTGVGFGLGLIGTILIIDSNKWMKKISVGPNGIGIKYVF